jgi:sialic acid synthase SpsE
MPSDDRPLIVAELCQNHGGDPDLMERMVRAAASAGADFAKIQALYSREIAFRPRFETGSVDEAGERAVLHRPFAAEVARLSALDLGPDAEARFVGACRAAGIGSMITVFTTGHAERLAGLGFDAVKLASADCTPSPLHTEVARHWDRVVLSTGAATAAEVADVTRAYAGRSLTLLHCTMVYPTPLRDVRLRRMDALRAWCPNVGWSDHTAPDADGLTASKAALALGATMVERHFTVLDRSETRDGPVSVTPAELRELRTFAELPPDDRRAWFERTVPDPGLFLGDGDVGPTPAELVNRDYYRGRVAAPAPVGS